MPSKYKPSNRLQVQEIEQDQEFILMDSAKPHWYVIQTYVGFEDAVRTLLEQRIENLSLDEKILEIFIPTKTVIKLNTKGNRKEVQEKIYPGYIYVNMILDKETAYILQNTNYVSRIASTGNVAMSLEDGYIEKLKERLLQESSDNRVAGTTIQFKIGDMVKVIDGPFKDMTGKISSIDPNMSRLNVLLSIFERETEVMLDSLEVMKF